MKKLMVIGIALFAAFMFVVPASATTLELGGYYRIEGRWQDSPNLDKDNDDGGARWRMRFRFTPALIVSDALRFDFKADIFDGTTFGTFKNKTSTAKENTGTYIDVDRAWMTVTTSFGKFAGGRMAGGSWGLTFGDDNEDYDRIRFDTKFGNVSTGVIVQKNVERDSNESGDSIPGQVDADTDVYYAYGLYGADFGKIGLLGAFQNGKSTTTADTTKYALLPYFDTKFGNFGVRGELAWATGDTDPDAAAAATTDIEELMWNLEADVTFGAFKFTAGYAWVQGDASAADTKSQEANQVYGGIGDDWDLLVVLMDVDTFINGHAYGSFPAGVKLWYAQLDWKANKTWNFWTTIGGATAQNTGQYGVNASDKMGTEIDVNAQWAVMKNLKFLVRFGYLDAGDFWKSTGITNLDNTYSAYQQWTLSF